MRYRDFTAEERCLVAFLLRAAKKDEGYISEFFSKMQCYDMDDGGMGSIRFVSPGNGEVADTRKFGEEVCSCHFTDEDGVTVSAALYVDSAVHPFELDVWKVDFSPLIRMPGDNSKFILDHVRVQ